MSIEKQFENLVAAYQKTAYFKWMKSEGLPIVQGHGVEDVRELSLAPWSRVGGKGCFVQLHGMEGVSSMYIAEIPPGGALNPEKHLYEKIICILEGQGATEVWQDGGPKRMFEWGPYSLFAPPLNSWHRLVNGGREPAKFLAMTNAPVIMDVFHNLDFVFNNPFQFSDRYKGEEDFFAVGNKRYEQGMQHIWETNFIPDIKSARLDERTVKGSGVQITQFEVSGNGLIGHISSWPEGRYHKAHYHGPGAVLLGLESSGYVLLWSKEIGTKPFQSGRENEVVEIKWKEGSVYCPPNGWYHQHFNTGRGSARHLAVRYGSRINSVGFMLPGKRQDDGVYLTAKEGGTMIDYEDEDPVIRRMYEDELRKSGIKAEMPAL